MLNSLSLLRIKEPIISLFDLAIHTTSESFKPKVLKLKVEGDGNTYESFIGQFGEIVSESYNKCLNMAWTVPVELDQLSSFMKTFVSICELRKTLVNDCSKYLPDIKLTEWIKEIYKSIQLYV
jgi:hypothetical protein